MSDPDCVGSWTATSVTHTNNANAGQSFDIIGAGGEVRTTVLENFTSRTWVEFDTLNDEWDSQLSLSGSSLTVDPVEAGRPTRTWAVEMNSAGDSFTTTDTNSQFDFTLSNGTPVSTTEVIVWAKQ